jgi:hypothetical protein
MARPASNAERTCRLRQAFELAREMGCLPREAEVELRRREAMASDRAAMARLAAQQNRPLPRPRLAYGPEPEEPRRPHRSQD